MSEPSIISLVYPPDRVAEGSDYYTALVAWVTAFNSTVASFNVFMDYIQTQTPAAIGAFPLATASEIPITGATTLTETAFGKMHVANLAADGAVGLPAAAGHAGEIIGIRVSYACTKLVTLDANGGELIDGATTRVMWAGESAILLCDGVGWAKVVGKSIPMVCRMQGPDSQSIAASTYTTLALTAAVVNVGSLADTSGSRILVRRAGLYNITGQFSLQGLPTNVVAGFQLLLNGRHLNYGGGAGLLNGTTPTSDILAACAAGAAVTMRGYHAHTSTLVTGTGAFLSATEVIQW